VRGYDDPCGTARTLDVIGERWALLTVRELLFGPKRFGQLRSALHGISPNVLSQRLRELENSGIVRRTVLDPPASVAVYDLTERGRQLEPVLVELGRWGSRAPLTSSAELTVDALLLAFKTCFAGTDAPDSRYALCIDGEWCTLETVDGRIEVRRGRQDGPTATLAADVGTFRAVMFHRIPLADAERGGRIAVSGDRRAARRFPKLFALPAERRPAMT
jgi:DNA-binding HxlR family transcriptional regulator